MPRRMLTSDTKQLWHPFIRSIRNPAIRHSSGRNSLTRAHPASISPPSAQPPPPLSALLSSKTATGLEFPTSTPAPASAASIITSFSKKLILNSSRFSTFLSSSHQFLVHRKQQQQQQQPLNRRLYSSTTTTMASATSFYDFKPLDSTSCIITHYQASTRPLTHPSISRPLPSNPKR